MITNAVQMYVFCPLIALSVFLVFLFFGRFKW